MLRGIIQRVLERNRTRVTEDAQAAASARLARDLGLPNSEVSRILDRTAADLRKLSDSADDVDARPIIDRAARELSSLGYQSRPFDEAAMEQYLKELPPADHQVLRLFKAGKKHSEIAALMQTDAETIRRSLVKTYADLRIRMIAADGESERAAEQG